MSETARRHRALSLIRRAGGRRRSGKPSADTQEPDVRSIEYDGTIWIDVRHPNGHVLEELGQQYNLHPLTLEDMTSHIQRPKTDVYDDYLFVVMQFPIHDKATRRNVSGEIDIVVGHDVFITVHDGNLRPLVSFIDSIFESDQMSIKLLRRTPGHLLYEVLDRMVDYLVPVVPQLEERIERIEEMIFQTQATETVQEISYVRRDLIQLRRILKPQLPIISRFEHGNLPFMDQEIDDYWGDVSDHLARTLDSIEELTEILAGLSETHNTFISQRMNDIIKTLTIFSVIMLPLTLLSGIFGMNTPLPEQGDWTTTILILVAMIGISVGMLIYFRQKRWL